MNWCIGYYMQVRLAQYFKNSKKNPADSLIPRSDFFPAESRSTLSTFPLVNVITFNKKNIQTNPPLYIVVILNDCSTVRTQSNVAVASSAILLHCMRGVWGTGLDLGVDKMTFKIQIQDFFDYLMTPCLQCETAWLANAFFFFVITLKYKVYLQFWRKTATLVFWQLHL